MRVNKCQSASPESLAFRAESLTQRQAASRSQSSKTIAGDFPPSSRETFLRLVLDEAGVDNGRRVSFRKKEVHGTKKELTLDDTPSGTAGTGERDLVDIGVLNDGLASCKKVQSQLENKNQTPKSETYQSARIHK